MIEIKFQQKNPDKDIDIFLGELGHQVAETQGPTRDRNQIRTMKW